MSLSVTLSKKKFQLFQPMGGVWATFCDAGGVLGATGACDDAVREVKASTARESGTKMRMG
jgi:hypothetical protein